MQHLMPLLAVAAFVLSTAAAQPAAAQPGWVLSHQKISDTEGGFNGNLNSYDYFGHASASLGDLDGDGIGDLAVADLRFAVWILFLNPDGTVKSHQRISATEGGFTGDINTEDGFARSVTSLGDLNGDGVGDLALGAPGDDIGRGAVWILFLNTNGTVISHQKISYTEGGFTGTLDQDDWFGISVASLGDLNGDSIGDLAVGAHLDDDGGPDQGALWILFLNPNGTVKSHQKISETEGGFAGDLEYGDLFGLSVASLGDIDGDGVGDLVVGEPFDGLEINHGAVWILFLNTDGTVKYHHKISDPESGYSYRFGYAVASLVDLDGDRVRDLAVGALGDSDGGPAHGAVWILFLNPDGTIKADQKISDTEGGFTGDLDDYDRFGASLAFVDDLDGDGVGDLAVGAPWDDDGGPDRGAVWVLFLDGVPVPDNCPADLYSDGNVGALDLALLLGSWGPCAGCPAD